MPEIHDSFSNPPPPSGMEATKDKEEHPLTNEDFRKLMMTPRVVSSKQTPSLNHSTKSESIRSESVSSRSENRKQKKTYYAQLKKQEESVLAELAKKYRDRARERRDGGADEGQSVEVDPLVATAGYRAVAPDAKSGIDAAERRRQMIQKSKFLGGDMEHTHLVKGLDYALLQKVRSEITNKESEDVELEETLKTTKSKNDEDEEEKIQFKTRLAKNIYRQVFKIKPPERNENFLPGRMAYIIELDDEFADSDVPTTLMRSKTDCPSMESQTTLTTNDIVINKLTQILSYLRSGMRNKKLKKKDKVSGTKGKDDENNSLPNNKMHVDDSIYGNIGEYDPISSYSTSKHRDKERSSRDKKRDYFEKSHSDDRGHDRREREERDRHHHHHRKPSRSNESKWSSSDVKNHDNSQRSSEPIKTSGSKKTKGMNLGGDSYAECYPGAPETADAVEDSDDEVDYSKMDMGNKKGPIGRWDFDTQEEYSDYMSHKEALPKAAFQYGVKMSDGRKTRRAGAGKKDEKAVLDREWQKISQIISKRKVEGSGSSSLPKRARR